MVNGKGTIQPFNVDIDVVPGNGDTIMIWEYGECTPTAFGTFLYDCCILLLICNSKRGRNL